MKKSKISTTQACRKAFVVFPERFTAIHFCEFVRSILSPYRPMDGTILRRLRELRENDSQYKYRVIDNLNSIYEKDNNNYAGIRLNAGK